MAYIVMTYIVMAYMVMAYIVMAYRVMEPLETCAVQGLKSSVYSYIRRLKVPGLSRCGAVSQMCPRTA